MRERSYNPPDEALEALARCLLPTIQSYFESEEGQREFEQWKNHVKVSISVLTRAELIPAMPLSGIRRIFLLVCVKASLLPAATSVSLCYCRLGL